MESNDIDEKEKDEVKDIEVVSGNGDNLDISPVETHLPISKPKIQEKNNKPIIIPTEKKDKNS